MNSWRYAALLTRPTATDPPDTSASDLQPPEDADSVRRAFHLGWAIAELRGRYRPDLSDNPTPDAGPVIGRLDHALPLANERTPGEHRVELYLQGVLWRDMIRGERRPQDLDPVPVGDLLVEVQLVRKLWSAFWLQLIIGLVGAAALVAGVTALAAGIKNRGIATALAVLGALGITVTGAYARAKANAASVLATVRETIERERVGRAAALVPVRPKRKRRWLSRTDRTLRAGQRRDRH